EVASIGGTVRQYQIDVDPNRLRAYKIPLSAVVDAVLRSNRNVGGNVVEASGTWSVVRGLGLIESVRDVEDIVIGAEGGVPIFIKQVAQVKVGDAFRAAALVKGTDEAVGGVVVARYGVSTVDVINRVKEKITALQAGLPAGVKIVSFYDRSALIQRAVQTLKRALIEETIVVTLVNVVFLLHLRSVLIVTIPLPLAVLTAFLFMRYLGISSNIMSLAGIAIAIGVLVDAGIGLTENAFRFMEKRGVNTRNRRRVAGPYRPLLALALRRRPATLAVARLVVPGAVALVRRIGREFMPPRSDGDLMFMPVTDPSIGLGQAVEIARKQNAAIRTFPKVASVVAKVARADTSTDPAPVNMTETVVSLKPEREWRPGMTREKLIGELDEATTLPGVSNIWTQPIINRINMLTTGIRSEVGAKVFGNDLNVLQERARAVADV